MLSTAKVHDRVRTGALGVVVSFDDGLLDVVDPHDLGYHVDAQQVLVFLICEHGALCTTTSHLICCTVDVYIAPMTVHSIVCMLWCW